MASRAIGGVARSARGRATSHDSRGSSRPARPAVRSRRVHRRRRSTASSGSAGSRSTPKALRERALEVVRRAVPFDAHVWLLTDPVSCVGTSPLADVPMLAWPRLPELGRQRYLTTVNRWTELRRAGTPAASLHAATDGDLPARRCGARSSTAWASPTWRRRCSRTGSAAGPGWTCGAAAATFTTAEVALLGDADRAAHRGDPGGAGADLRRGRRAAGAVAGPAVRAARRAGCGWSARPPPPARRCAS